MKVKS